MLTSLFARKPAPKASSSAPARSSPKPSILIVTIPKSGTVYMNAMFREGLGLQDFYISNRYFPDDQLNLDVMRQFQSGGFFASAHIDASSANLQLLDRFVPKWVVHFRDPRSVTLSWVYHIERLAEEGRFEDMLRVCPVPPAELHGWTFARRVDWHLENFLPGVVRWMENWLDAIDRLGDRVLVSEFKSLKESEVELSERILKHLGIRRSEYTHNAPAKTMDSHYRTGAHDEWRTAFTSDQNSCAAQMITPRLYRRFSWPQ